MGQEGGKGEGEGGWGGGREGGRGDGPPGMSFNQQTAYMGQDQVSPLFILSTCSTCSAVEIGFSYLIFFFYIKLQEAANSN